MLPVVGAGDSSWLITQLPISSKAQLNSFNLKYSIICNFNQLASLNLFTFGALVTHSSDARASLVFFPGFLKMSQRGNDRRGNEGKTQGRGQSERE
jgi:hypothetical protein